MYHYNDHYNGFSLAFLQRWKYKWQGQQRESKNKKDLQLENILVDLGDGSSRNQKENVT
jgi:hypothetical protein